MAMGYQPVQRGTVNFGWIQESWQLFLPNAVAWAVSTLIMGAILFAVEFGLGLVFGLGGALSAASLASASSGSSPNPMSTFTALAALPMYWVVILLVSAGGAFFASGLLKMANACVRGQQIEVGMIFQGGPTFIPVLAVQFALGIAASIGFAVCFIPGFFVVGLFLPALAMAADGVSIGDSISRSIDAMKSNWLMAGAFAFVMYLIVAVSMLPCGLGVFVTTPMLLICMSLAYRDLVGMPGAESPASASFNQFGGAPTGQWPPPPGQGAPTQPLGGQPQPGQTSTPYMPYSNQPLAGTPQQSAYETPAPEPEPSLEELPSETIDESGDAPRAE